MLEGLRVDALGMNCGLGPKQMMPILEDLMKYTSLPVVVKPNAGLPKQKDGETYYDVEPEEFAEYMRRDRRYGGLYHRWMLRYNSGTYPRNGRTDVVIMPNS